MFSRGKHSRYLYANVICEKMNPGEVSSGYGHVVKVGAVFPHFTAYLI